MYTFFIHKIIKQPRYGLDLRSCGVGNAGVTAIAKQLFNNDYFGVLDLSENPFTAVGANALAEMLKRNKVLKYFYLNDHAAGSDAIESVGGI